MCKCSDKNIATYCGICVNGDYKKALIRDFPEMFNTCMFDMGISYEFYKELHFLCRCIKNQVDHRNHTGAYAIITSKRTNPVDGYFRFTQLKTKFHHLCLYHDTNMDRCNGYVDMAEHYLNDIVFGVK